MTTPGPMLLPCPACGHLEKKQIDWIRCNSSYRCIACGSNVEIDSKELLAPFAQLEVLIDELKRDIENIGKEP